MTRERFLPWAYYGTEKRYDREGNLRGITTVLFNIDHCERCNKEVRGPNCVSTPESNSRLESLGCEPRELPNDELGVWEETGECICTDCYSKLSGEESE